MCAVYLRDSEEVLSISSRHLEPVTPVCGNKVKVILGMHREYTGTLLCRNRGIVRMDFEDRYRIFRLNFLVPRRPGSPPGRAGPGRQRHRRYRGGAAGAAAAAAGFGRRSITGCGKPSVGAGQGAVAGGFLAAEPSPRVRLPHTPWRHRRRPDPLQRGRGECRRATGRWALGDGLLAPRSSTREQVPAVLEWDWSSCGSADGSGAEQGESLCGSRQAPGNGPPVSQGFRLRRIQPPRSRLGRKNRVFVEFAGLFSRQGALCAAAMESAGPLLNAVPAAGGKPGAPRVPAVPNPPRQRVRGNAWLSANHLLGDHCENRCRERVAQHILGHPWLRSSLPAWSRVLLVGVAEGEEEEGLWAALLCRGVCQGCRGGSAGMWVFLALCREECARHSGGVPVCPLGPILGDRDGAWPLGVAPRHRSVLRGEGWGG
ncbi:uncharacterized protein LOC141974073 [Athene noctua]|uniref:uncharacterized protein LOC141974073 n=1 Tax=Athene noctua TaxID=126797 RepID=UPI003EB79A3A